MASKGVYQGNSECDEKCLAELRLPTLILVSVKRLEVLFKELNILPTITGLVALRDNVRGQEGSTQYISVYENLIRFVQYRLNDQLIFFSHAVQWDTEPERVAYAQQSVVSNMRPAD